MGAVLVGFAANVNQAGGANWQRGRAFRKLGALADGGRYNNITVAERRGLQSLERVVDNSLGRANSKFADRRSDSWMDSLRDDDKLRSPWRTQG